MTEENLAQARKQNGELALILSEEKKDVDKLEQLSVANLFATILGTKDDKLKKERQEYLAAKLKYDAVLVWKFRSCSSEIQGYI